MSLFQNLSLETFFSEETLITVIRVVLYFIVGFLLVRITARLTKRILAKQASAQSRMLVSKAIVYTGFTLLAFIILIELGVELTPLLGAAGIAGIALGIASQASLSNIISGLFLISEKPFEIGDVIKWEGTIGTVISIDLLSVKVRTFDNLFIRLPNQAIVSSEVTNITRFPIRRMDINLTVGLKEDLAAVRRVLEEIARDNPLCLEEPEPLILFLEFTDLGVKTLFAVWFAKADYLSVKNALIQEISTQFREQGIDLAYPQRLVRLDERVSESRRK